MTATTPDPDTTRAADPAAMMRTLWDLLDRQAWDGLVDVLDPKLRVDYVHTGEAFDRDGYVRLNRDYPGRWRVRIDDLVVDDDRAVTRVRLTDGTRTYYVASFGTVRDGRITELVEVWTDADATPPPGTRPS